MGLELVWLYRVFLHLFLFEFIYALLPHCTFCHCCSLWLLCGATSFEDIATLVLTEPEPGLAVVLITEW